MPRQAFSTRAILVYSTGMILCCGEALVDMLPRKSEAGEPAYAPYAGGASFNTAIALGRLGVPTGFLSGISFDLFGQLLARTLADSNVAIDYTARSERPTTLAFVDLVDGQANYTFYGENAADRMLGESDLPEIDDAVTALQFGAISLAQEPCGTTYEALMRRESGKRVILLDPNIRPNFIADRDSHLARMRRMIALADIIKISDEDMRWFGEEGDTDAIAGRWLDAGPRLVVITAGAAGITAYFRGGKVHADVRRIDVVDTVGAGDTFSAGLMASLWRDGLMSTQTFAGFDKEAIARALDLGTRAAAVTVSRAGANPPWADEIGF